MEMNQTAQNHQAFFELLAKSKDSIRLYDKKPVFSVWANQGIYPRLTLCYNLGNAETNSFDTYFTAVEQLEASPRIIIEKNADSATFEQLFKQNGFRPVEEWTSMQISLTDLENESNAELIIETVKNEHQLGQWLSIVEKTLFNGNHINRLIFNQLRENEDTTMWLGYLSNQPISTALSFIHKDTVGLYMISTSGEFRGKGFGQEITAKALLDAAGKGISIGVLQATRQGLNLYKKIGFQENGKFIIYWKVGKKYM